MKKGGISLHINHDADANVVSLLLAVVSRGRSQVLICPLKR